MNPATRILHEALIRLAKGMLKAWEEWVRAQIQMETTDGANGRK